MLRGGRAAFIIGASLHTCGLAKLVMKGRYSAYLRKIRVYLEDNRTYLTKISHVSYEDTAALLLDAENRAYLTKISRVSCEDIVCILRRYRAYLHVISSNHIPHVPDCYTRSPPPQHLPLVCTAGRAERRHARGAGTAVPESWGVLVRWRALEGRDHPTIIPNHPLHAALAARTLKNGLW